MNSSETQIGLLVENTWGELPSPATFIPLRFTSDSLKIDREYIESEEIRDDRNVADNIQVGGGAGGALNGEFSYGTFDEILSSGMFSAWVTDALVNGVSQKSFQILKKQTGGGDSPVYELYSGMVVDQITIDIEAKKKITINTTFVGKNGNISAVSTGSFGSPTTKIIADASNAFALNDAFGASPLPKLMKMTININNGLAGKPVAGQVDLDHITAGQCKITGSAQFYMKNKLLMDKFLAGTSGAINLDIGSVTNEKYNFNIPAAKIVDADHFSPNNDDDVMLNVTWRAGYNSGIDGALKITRAVA